MGINDNFAFLSIGLPADIERRKQRGDFDGAVRLIDRRLGEDIPEALKKCMIAEREMILRLPSDYPFTRAEALAMIRADVPDFSDAEFDDYVDGAKIDWIYIDGEEHFFKRFYKTLVKSNLDFAKRAHQVRGAAEGEDAETSAEKNLLERTIAEMQEKGSVSYRFRIRGSLAVKDESFQKGETALVHLPIPAVCRQQSDIVIEKTSHTPLCIAAEDAPQRTVSFRETLEENKPFFVEYAYTNTVRYIDAYNASGSGVQPTFFLEEQQPHIVFTPYIRELVRTLTDGITDPMAKARAFYDFVTRNVKYTYMREYFGLNNIAESCARSLRGDCGVQALLFITLCRCAGIPAKWQSSLCITPPDDVGAHDWAEFYVAPYGWLFADPSYGGGAHRVGNEARRRFYFGNLDPFRMIANREFQAPLTPDKAHWRADPYDNQTGEIEYTLRGLRYPEYVRDQELLSWTKL